MPYYAAKIRLISISFILSLASMLTACGGGDGGDKSASSSNNDIGVILGSSGGEADHDTGNGGSTVLGVASTTPVTISGSVGDGPVIGATVIVLDADGVEIARTTSNLSASYSAVIPSGSTFPLVITASGGTDIVTHQEPTFSMISTVITPEDTTANINPFSTLIVKTAGRMPSGLTAANMRTATRNILAIFNSGLDTTLIPNPITVPITAQNVATIIKSSEVLAEIIRRNQEALLVVYPSFSQDDLIAALAADISDGNFDGAGSTGADPMISAVNTIVSAQVLTEALSNTLKVNNIVATNALDDAIKVVVPGATQKTGDLPANNELLLSIRTALAAAMTIAPSEVLSELEIAVESINAGSTVEEIIGALPPDTGASLDEAINETSTSPAEELGAVNDLTGAVYEDPVEIDTTSNIALLATATASSENILKEQPAAKAIDGIVSGYPVNRKKEWVTLNEGSGAWIQLNWPTAQSISEVVLHDRLNAADQILSGALHFSDGSSIEIGSLPNDSSGLTATFPARQVTWIRFSINSVSETTQNVGLAEWEVYVQPHTASSNANNNTPSIPASDVATNDGGDSYSAGSNEQPDDASNVSPDITEADMSVLFTLTWNPNPSSDNVLGYKVFFGATQDSANTELTDITVFSGGFDPNIPSIQYDSKIDLGLKPGEGACFKIRAYNADGLSDWSMPVCGTIPKSI